MSKSLTRNKLNSKASRGSGGGGGTGNMNTSTYDPAGISRQLLGTAIPLTQAEAVAKSDYIEGQLYCITDPPAPLKEFYAFAILSPDSVYLFPTLDTHGFGYTVDDNYCLAVFAYNVTSGEEIKSITIPASNVKVSTNGTNTNAVITEQLRLSGTNIVWYNCVTTATSGLTANTFSNCSFENCTIDADSFTGCYIENYGGLEDTITFTNNNQYISGLNKARGRTISFINTTGLFYQDCTLGSGKVITIRSSQSDKYWISDQSSFQEDLDVADTSLYDNALKQLDLTNYGHAGHIKIINSGGITNPAFVNVIGLPTYEMCYEFFADTLTCNPEFQPGTGNVLVNNISLGANPVLIIGASDSVIADNKGYGALVGFLRIIDAVIM